MSDDRPGRGGHHAPGVDRRTQDGLGPTGSSLALADPEPAVARIRDHGVGGRRHHWSASAASSAATSGTVTTSPLGVTSTDCTETATWGRDAAEGRPAHARSECQGHRRKDHERQSDPCHAFPHRNLRLSATPHEPVRPARWTPAVRTAVRYAGARLVGHRVWQDLCTPAGARQSASGGPCVAIRPGQCADAPSGDGYERSLATS